MRSRSSVFSSARIPWLAFRVVMTQSYPKGPQNMGKLDGKRIAILVANEGIEQVELTEPWEALREAGAATDLISLEEGEVQAFNHLDKADTFEVEKVVGEVSVED